MSAEAARWRTRVQALAGGAGLTNAALIVFGVLLVQLSRVGVHEFQHFRYGFSADVFGQVVIFLGAFSLVERSPTNRWTLPIVFTFAVLARLVCVFHPAFLSTDVYRYVWDGQVQAAGINPFRYIPADSHLSFLRDNAIYPHINRRDYAHTIYPPGAQALFLAITRISASEPFMKLAMVGFEVITCAALLRMLALLHLPRGRVLLYAWNPLCIWEVASSGHVDAAALTFLTLAFCAVLLQQPARAGGWLGAATLVKLYPVVLLAAVCGYPVRWYGRRVVGAVAGVVLFGYACYVSVGAGVFGFLPSYAQEEGIRSGERYFPLTFVNRTLHASIPTAAYIVFCAAVMGSVAVWAMRRRVTPADTIFSALVIATVATLCFAPHYPWYFLWLLPCLTVSPWLPALYLVIASTFLFATQLGAPGEPLYLLNKLLYGGFFAVLAYDLLQHRIFVYMARAGARIQTPRAAQLRETLAEAGES